MKAEGALSTAFIPVFTDYLATRPRVEFNRMLRAVAGGLLLTLCAVSAVGALLAPWLVAVMAPGFSAVPEQLRLATTLTRLMFPYLIFVGLAALAMGVLNAHRRFFTSALGPAALNVGMIAAVLLLPSPLPVPVLALPVGRHRPDGVRPGRRPAQRLREHAPRVAPPGREHLLPLLRRPGGGVPARRVRDRRGQRIAPRDGRTGRATRPEGPRRDGELRPAAVLLRGGPGVGGALAPAGAAHARALRARTLRGPGGPGHRLGPGLLRPGIDRVRRGEDRGPGGLRARRHPPPPPSRRGVGGGRVSSRRAAGRGGGTRGAAPRSAAREGPLCPRWGAGSPESCLRGRGI